MHTSRTRSLRLRARAGGITITARASARAGLGTTIAPRRRAGFLQALLRAFGGRSDVDVHRERGEAVPEGAAVQGDAAAFVEHGQRSAAGARGSDRRLRRGG